MILLLSVMRVSIGRGEDLKKALRDYIMLELKLVDLFKSGLPAVYGWEGWLMRFKSSGKPLL